MPSGCSGFMTLWGDSCSCWGTGAHEVPSSGALHQDRSTGKATVAAVPGCACCTPCLQEAPGLGQGINSVLQKRKPRLRDSVTSSRVTSQCALSPDMYCTTCENHLLYAGHLSPITCNIMSTSWMG